MAMIPNVAIMLARIIEASNPEITTKQTSIVITINASVLFLRCPNIFINMPINTLMLYPEATMIWVVPVVFKAFSKSSDNSCFDPNTTPDKNPAAIKL